MSGAELVLVVVAALVLVIVVGEEAVLRRGVLVLDLPYASLLLELARLFHVNAVLDESQLGLVPLEHLVLDVFQQVHGQPLLQG